MMAAPRAQFVTEHHYAVLGGSQDISFAGAQAGDLAIIFAVHQSGIGGLSAWTLVAHQLWSPNTNDVWSKILTAADITAGKVTVTGANNGPIGIAFYRAVSSVTLVSSATVGTGNNTLTIPGFTKNALSKGVLTWLGGEGADGGTLTVPSGTTARIAPFGTSIESAAVADILPATGYANGTALTWTGLFDDGVSTAIAGGMILELT
jgi:hypothetical protein